MTTEPHWQIVSTEAGHHARLVTGETQPDGTPDCLVWSEPVPDLKTVEDTIRAVHQSFNPFDGQMFVLDVVTVDEREPIPLLAATQIPLVAYPTGDPFPDLSGMPIPYDPATMP